MPGAVLACSSQALFHQKSSMMSIRRHNEKVGVAACSSQALLESQWVLCNPGRWRQLAVVGAVPTTSRNWQPSSPYNLVCSSAELLMQGMFRTLTANCGHHRLHSRPAGTCYLAQTIVYTTESEHW